MLREINKATGAYVVDGQLMVMVPKNRRYELNEKVLFEEKTYRVSWTTRWWAGLGNKSKRLVTLEPVDTRPVPDYIPKKIIRFAGVRN